MHVSSTFTRWGKLVCEFHDDLYGRPSRGVHVNALTATDMSCLDPSKRDTLVGSDRSQEPASPTVFQSNLEVLKVPKCEVIRQPTKVQLSIAVPSPLMTDLDDNT